MVFLFAVIIILPIHYTYTGKYGYPWDGNRGDGNSTGYSVGARELGITAMVPLDGKDEQKTKTDPTYLWMYVVFSYVFTGLAIYLLMEFTNKIIRIRQQYLGGQTTMTDRTIRLSGVPPELRSEEKVKDFIENLEIGKVESVMFCCDWRELDDLMKARKKVLQRLEEAWTQHLGYRWKRSHGRLTRPVRSESLTGAVDSTERSRLLSGEDGTSQAHVSGSSRERPRVRIRYGPLKLRFKSIDAIDYYEEKLRRLDEEIEIIRQKEFPPTPLAFVTMESIAACQMAVQAILDPAPMQLVASLAPAPADVVWQHTYLSRSQRMIRGWSITLLIGVLTIFWSIILIPLAYLLNLETIEKVFPQLAEALSQHPLAKSLVQTGLPTLILSLLNIAVPYIYNCRFQFSSLVFAFNGVN